MKPCCKLCYLMTMPRNTLLFTTICTQGTVAYAVVANSRLFFTVARMKEGKRSWCKFFSFPSLKHNPWQGWQNRSCPLQVETKMPQVDEIANCRIVTRIFRVDTWMMILCTNSSTQERVDRELELFLNFKTKCASSLRIFSFLGQVFVP